MNCYASLTEIKAVLGISSTTDDTVMLNILEAASRAIDEYCQRHFYAETDTRYFDGAGTRLWIDDLLSVTTFKKDDDGDATFEDTLATTDYNLYPLNTYPKWQARISEDSNYAGFALGIDKGVEIDGLWGYGNGRSATPYSASGITVVADDATETELDVSAEGTIEPGHTILVESEQIYVSAVSSDGTKKITVERAVNGTTGAAHATKAASIYEYPKDIWQACVSMASGLYDMRQKQGMKSEELGDYSYSISESYLDNKILGLLRPYRKVRYN